MPKGIFVRSEEHKKHIAEAMRGRVMSEEWKQRISDGKSGKKLDLTDEQHQARSARVTGTRNPFFGRTHTQKAKRAAAEKLRGRTALLKKYGISDEEYSAQIAAGNRWCCQGKHFGPSSDFNLKGSRVCDSCKSSHHRANSLRKAFGVDQEWYLEKLAEQDGKCAICKTEKVGTNGKKHFAIDHDHITGQLRGILCFRCNHALERIDNIPNWGALATAYVVRYATHQPTPEPIE
jgi:hypothetical protein